MPSGRISDSGRGCLGQPYLEDARGVQAGSGNRLGPVWPGPYLTIIVAVLFAPSALSAGPHLAPFSPPTRPDWHVEGLWKATIINPDTQVYACSLHGRIDRAGTDDSVFSAWTVRFEVRHGTRTYHYRDVRVVKTWNAPGFDEFAARTGTLPDGDWEFNLWLEPNYGGKSIVVHVRPMGPPRLMLPSDRDTNRLKYPQFIWTRPTNATGPVSYGLKLVEVLSGLTPEGAMASMPTWLELKNIRTTAATYPAWARPLPDTSEFCWQITARDQRGGSATSEVHSFQRSPPLTPGPTPTGGIYFESPHDGDTVFNKVSVWIGTDIKGKKTCVFEYCVPADSPPSGFHGIGSDIREGDLLAAQWDSRPVLEKRGKGTAVPCVLRATVTDATGGTHQASIRVTITTRKDFGCGGDCGK